MTVCKRRFCEMNLLLGVTGTAEAAVHDGTKDLMQGWGIELPHPNAIPIALCLGRNLHSKIVLDVVGTRYPKHPSRIP